MHNNNKKVLGRGLSALLADNSAITRYENADENQGANSASLEILVDLIEPNPWQPRRMIPERELKELSESIAIHGIIQPIALRKNGERYQIIAGERRWRASQLAGLKQVPANIINLADEEMLEIALIENIQRQDLNPVDEARAFETLLKFSTQVEVAQRVGKSRSYIANSVRLLSLPQDVQDRLMKKEITVGHARALIGNPNASEAAKQISEQKMNVRQTEQRFSGSDMLADKTAERKPFSMTEDPEYNNRRESTDDVHDIEAALTDILGMKVRIRDGIEGGIMSIQFFSLEQLDYLVSKLSGVQVL
jgi:ParB family chromosome partitioning protein